MAKRPSTCLLSNDLFVLKLDHPRGKLRIDQGGFRVSVAQQMLDHCMMRKRWRATGFHVTHPLYAGVETWEEVAAILRTLWQQELDGFSHEPPAVDNLERERGKDDAGIPPAPEPTNVDTAERANTASPVILYKKALDLLDEVIKESDIYSYLYDHRTDYDEATAELLSDLSYYMEKAAGEYSKLNSARYTISDEDTLKKLAGLR